METNHSCEQKDQRECFFCEHRFQPYRTVKDWQYACCRKKCQALRQRLNERDWHQRNSVKREVWYQSYYKTWRQKQPDYQKQYRQRKKDNPITEKTKHTREYLRRLLKDFQAFQAERRKRLKKQRQQLIAAIRAARSSQPAYGFG